MTISELIHELSQFPSNSNIGFHCDFEFNTEVLAEFDRDNESDLQLVSATPYFNDEIYYKGIRDRRNQYEGDVVIDLSN